MRTLNRTFQVVIARFAAQGLQHLFRPRRAVLGHLEQDVEFVVFEPSLAEERADVDLFLTIIASARYRQLLGGMESLEGLFGDGVAFQQRYLVGKAAHTPVGFGRRVLKRLEFDPRRQFIGPAASEGR